MQIPLGLISIREGNRWLPAVASDGQAVALEDLSLPGEVARSTRDLLAAGPDVVAAALETGAAALAAGDGLARVVSADEVGPPIPDPDKIICLGLNYQSHADEVGRQTPTAPTFFAKFRNSLVGPRAAIVPPVGAEKLDYEGELAFVIGQRCKDVQETDALEVVAGYSVFNDISARELQLMTPQWGAGKAIDTFAPMGPGLVPASAVPDPSALDIRTWVNGDLRQSASTSEMIFPIPAVIAFLTRLMTLEAGDIVATGTPSGVANGRPDTAFLRAGDLVQVEIGGLGRLENRVHASDGSLT